MTILPYCLSDELRPNAKMILELVIASLPEDDKLYLIGGAMRNSVYYYLHGVPLPQRDYDLIYVGGLRNEFIANLERNGFLKGEINRETQQVYKYPCISQPQSLDDYVVLDINFYKKGDITELVTNKANFTINGFWSDLTNITSEDWFDHVYSIEGAFDDTHLKRLRVNPKQSKDIAYSNLFAAIRFISQGFTPPERTVLRKMLQDHASYPEEKFENNVEKVYGYVGGEENARALVSSLGLPQSIFERSS